MTQPTNNSKTILVMVTGFLVLSALFGWRGMETASSIFLYLAVSIGVLALLHPGIEQLIVTGWMKIAAVMGRISSTVLLTAVFYLLLFPISMLSKLFRKDPLRLKNPKDTAYVERNYKYSKDDLQNIW